MKTDPTSSRSPPTAVALAVLIVSSLTVMANATISPALPGLAAAFADVPNVKTLSGLVLSLPSLAVVLTAGLFGAATSRVDRRRLLLGATICYALGGASGLLAPGLVSLLVGRVLLGIGVAGTMTIATLLAGELWAGGARDRFMGRQNAAMSAGGIVFLLAGGALAALSWRAPFALYALAVPAGLYAWSALAGHADGPSAPDSEGQGFDWRAFAVVGALATFGMIGFYVIPTRLPFLLESLGVVSPLLSGVAIAGVTAASLPSALGFGRLRERFASASLFAASFALMAAGYTVIAFANGVVAVTLGCLVAGLGLGALMPNLASTLMRRMPAPARGRAAGLLTVAVFLGQFLSPLVAGAVADVAGLSPSGLFGAFAGALAVAAVLCAFARRLR